MKAIQTRFIGCTNHKPSRIKATDGDGNSVTASYHNLSGASGEEDKHREVARLLCDKMKWHCEPLHTGWLKSSTYVHVFEAR